MPKWVQLGRRKSDIGLMIDFHKKRGLVRANTAWIAGYPLEMIPRGLNDSQTGMVLIHSKWNELYFLIERKDWSEDNYFAYAEKRFAELGVREP